MNLLPNEVALAGTWNFTNGQLIADATCIRIAKIVKSFLIFLGRDASGWDAIYLDPADGRYWELTYPQSELAGGGPPRLECLKKSVALEKYGSAVVGSH